jgi:hypothetical protein
MADRPQHTSGFLVRMMLRDKLEIEPHFVLRQDHL